MKKNKLCKLPLSLVFLLLIFGCATAPNVKESAVADDYAVITGIKVEDNGLIITSNKNFIYTVYKGNDPYKIMIDIPDMQAGDFKTKIVSDKGIITEIIPRQIDSPKPAVKFDITLQTPSSVTPLYKDNTLAVMLKPEGPADAVKPKEVGIAPEPAPPTDLSGPEKSAVDENAPAGAGAPDNTGASEEKPVGGAAPLPGATEIRSIELKKTADIVKVVITGNGAMMPNVFPIDEKIVIDIPGVSLHASLPSSTISPLKGVRAGKHKDKIRLVLDLKEKTSYDVAAKDNTIEISLKRKEFAAAESSSEGLQASKQEAAQKETGPKEAPSKEISSMNETVKPAEGRFKGKKISLDFQDADIGPIFRLLADVNGYNLVLDPAVKGKITIKLMSVPWDQALDIILNTYNFGARIEGNILWIAPMSMFAKISEERSKANEVEEKSEELMQEVIRVNYAAAGEIQGAISQGKLLSTRGSITIDNRMNTLIIKDTQKSIDKIKDLVKIMDVSKPQVMIEAKLVQVSTDYTEQLGISWGGNWKASSNWIGDLSGNFSVNTPAATAGVPNQAVPGGRANMPQIGSANTLQVFLTIDALETLSKAKTLSNPKVLTVDNEAASIQQGTTFFIPTVSQSGTQTQQVQATLSLTVTPKITPDGYVQLKVNATDNALLPNATVGTGSNSSPVVDTKSITTLALVKNGETLVLGGIYKTTINESETGVPFLSKIPGLGWLFKKTQMDGPHVSELLIFITPTIVSQPM